MHASHKCNKKEHVKMQQFQTLHLKISSFDNSLAIAHLTNETPKLIYAFPFAWRTPEPS